MPLIFYSLFYFTLLTCFLSYFTTISQANVINADSFFFTVSPENQDVEEGKPFRLNCRVTPEKDIIYRWYLNDVPFQPDGERRILENNSNLVVLHADTALDQGFYLCQAFNKSSSFSLVSKKASVNVFLMSPKVTVQLKEPSEKSAIRYGNPVTLSCDAHAQPPIGLQSILWYFNARSQLPPGVLVDEATRELKIPEFKPVHSGAFHCRVYHAAGEVNSKPPMVLFMDPRNNSTLLSLRDEDFLKEVSSGEQLRLTCPSSFLLSDTVLSQTVKQPIWKYQPQLDADYVSALRLPGQVNVDGSDLTFQSFQEKHMNFYTCEMPLPSQFADGVILRFLFQVELAVIYNLKPTYFSPKANASMVYAKSLGNTLEIRFYMDLTPYRSFIAEQIPNPPPKIQWLDPNHREIPAWNKDTEPVQRIYALYGRHLRIRGITEADTGYYEFRLSNKAGNVSMNYFIAATFEPEFRTQTTENISVDEGKQVSLECGLTRAAPHQANTITWTRNGAQIVEGEKGIAFSPQRETLQIDSVLSSAHAGTYICNVHTIGFRSKSSNWKILIVKEALGFVKPIDYKFLESKVQGRIPCQTRGYGVIQVTWHKVEAGETLVPIKAPNQVDDGTLILQFVQKKDAGVYECKAHSNYKNQVRTMRVNVEVGESPRITFISPNTTVTEGEKVVLNCRATGDPIPVISWVFTGVGALSTSVIFEAASSSATNAPPSSASSAGAGAQDQRVGNAPAKDPRHQVINGSLIINSVRASDTGTYICVAGNSHRLEGGSQLGLHLEVLSEGVPIPDPGNSGLLRTIGIVVSCAVLYLVLIIALTTCCSVRVLRNRRKRSRLLQKPENFCLLSHPAHTATDQSTDPQSATHRQGYPMHSSMQQPRDMSRTSGTIGTRSTMPPLPPPGSLTSSNGLAGFPSSGEGTYSCDGPVCIRTTAPPPPTPIDSRSYFSGFSTPLTGGPQQPVPPSLFSQSVQLSTASTGLPPHPLPQPPLSSLERLAYPRSNLCMESLLGRGEFGDVYLMRATQIVEGEKQSLVMAKTLALHETLHIYEFQRQMDMFMKLDHSCITRVLGVCVEAEPKILILEYCEWGDLKQFLCCIATQLEASEQRLYPQGGMSTNRTGRLPPLPSVPQRLHMCAQIAQGMEHIANMRCLHRDLAARNILLTQDMNVKISHLGLCRDVYARDYCILRDRYQPLRWMAPEAILHDQFSVKSDVWSFGELVCELFNLAQQPYPHMTDAEVISAAKAQTLQPEAPTECPDSLRELLLRCWRETPRDRPDFGELSVLLSDVRT